MRPPGGQPDSLSKKNSLTLALPALFGIPGLLGRRDGAAFVQLLVPVARLVAGPDDPARLEPLNRAEDLQPQLTRLEQEPLGGVLTSMSPLVLRGENPGIALQTLREGPVPVVTLSGGPEALVPVSGLETLALLRLALERSLVHPEDGVPVTVRLEGEPPEVAAASAPTAEEMHRQLCDRLIDRSPLLSLPGLIQPGGARRRPGEPGSPLLTRASVASVVAELLCGGVASQRRQRFYRPEIATPEALDQALDQALGFFDQLVALRPHWAALLRTGSRTDQRTDLSFTPSLLRVLAAAVYRLRRDGSLTEAQLQAAIAWILSQPYEPTSPLLRDAGLARPVGGEIRLSTQQDDIVRTANRLIRQALADRQS